MLFSDEAVFSTQVLCNLRKTIVNAITIHDVRMHLYHFSLRRTLVNILCKQYRKIGIQNADNIILLSQNSKRLFLNQYPSSENKVRLLKLGAHVPKVREDKRPIEIKKEQKFFLFFGRIDKYKGIDTLINAYNTFNADYKKNVPLIIAGNGSLSKTEKCLIDNSNNILLINRFIENEEMIWLFKNCIAVVVPYKEASQSGVVPMAYFFGNPVLAANINGLNEYVIDKKTGFLCNSTTDYSEAMEYVTSHNMDNMKKEVELFTKENLNWRKNISALLNQLMEG